MQSDTGLEMLILKLYVCSRLEVQPRVVCSRHELRMSSDSIMTTKGEQ